MHGEGGEASRIGLGAAVAEPAPPPVPGDRGPALAICMATYEPPAELLERQLASLADQTVTDWVCVISDDASGDAAYGRLEELTAGDPRFVVSRAPERAGAYANFARALAMVPPGARHVALCDQDDRWYEAKLETLLGALGDARMVFSDMRLTTPAGAPISDTYWTSRVPNHDNFGSLLLGNSVTGAAALFRRDLLDAALPFPPRVGNLYHDHWLALVAAATGRIAYVDRPLYDYVQHPDAVIGHAGANRGADGGGLARRLAALRGRAPGRLRGEWRRIYFAEYCRMALTAVALEQRLGATLDPARRRALRLALALDRSPLADAGLAARQLRRLAHDDTGGSEAGMLRGLAWRRALPLRRGERSARRRRPAGGDRRRRPVAGHARPALARRPSARCRTAPAECHLGRPQDGQRDTRRGAAPRDVSARERLGDRALEAGEAVGRGEPRRRPPRAPRRPAARRAPGRSGPGPRRRRARPGPRGRRSGPRPRRAAARGSRRPGSRPPAARPPRPRTGRGRTAR